mmetsp:Transcript_27565/g.87269  ORF Transcript_27565/g.87269 Transcript_27565/m.87269 type:complete len:213 (+) Transcript_27565:2399-3037(+)
MVRPRSMPLIMSARAGLNGTSPGVPLGIMLASSARRLYELSTDSRFFSAAKRSRTKKRMRWPSEAASGRRKEPSFMEVRSTFWTEYKGPAASSGASSGYSGSCVRRGSLPEALRCSLSVFWRRSMACALRCLRMRSASAAVGPARGIASRPTRRPRCMSLTSSALSDVPSFWSREDSLSGGTAGASGSSPPMPSLPAAWRMSLRVLPSDLAQ